MIFKTLGAELSTHYSPSRTFQSWSGLHVPSSHQRRKQKKCLNMINTHARGKAVICGDWISRHKRWDRTSNRRGNQLVRRSKAKRWDIHPCDGFSFRTRRYKGNIDLFCDQEHGNWIGSIPRRHMDRKLTAQANCNNLITRQKHKAPAKSRISVKLWRDQAKASEVMESYRRKFPDIIKTVKECNRKKDWK